MIAAPDWEHFTAEHPGAVWLPKSQHAVSSMAPFGTAKVTFGFDAAAVPVFFTAIEPL